MIPDTSGRSPLVAFSAWRGRFSLSRLDLGRAALLALAAIAVGAIGWSGEPCLLPVATLFPALWSMSQSRTTAAMVSAGYFLAASRGLPQGVANFYDTDMSAGLFLWFAASAGFVLVHATLWTARPGWPRALRYCVAAILMSVPPFGIVGWAHPVTAAGVMFPGWGWFGLVATVLGLLVMTTRFWPIVAFIGFGAFLWSAVTWTSPNVPEGWTGINTGFQFTEAGQYADYAQHMATIAMVKEAAAQGAKTIVLPESSLGIWSATTLGLWTHELTGLDVTVNGGAIVLDHDRYDNVMIEISRTGAQVIYRERMPVPVSMWRPWTTGGANAHVFDNPIVDHASVSILPLICYEQLLIWPVLQSMLFDPDVIVATGNGWWTSDTNIVPIQKGIVEAWASLFGVPLVLAFNY